MNTMRVDLKPITGEASATLVEAGRPMVCCNNLGARVRSREERALPQRCR